MRSGILVPYDITISVIKDNIRCSDKEEKVLDGFPRNMEKNKALIKELVKNRILIFKTSSKVCKHAIVKRFKFVQVPLEQGLAVY